MSNFFINAVCAIRNAADGSSKQKQMSDADHDNYELAVRYSKSNDHRCLDIFQMLYSKHPTNYYNTVAYGSALAKFGNKDAGYDLLKRAISLCPAEPNAYIILASFYHDSGSYNDALEVYGNVNIRSLPDSQKHILEMGMASCFVGLYNNGETYIGRRAYEALLAIDSTGCSLPLYMQQFMHDYERQMHNGYR